MIFNMTGGGTSLNFKVVGGTTEPSNPKENTIWVNTDKEITGWHFATEQPEDMKEGEVWFYTGATSSVGFNALKKNNVTVYPQIAKQYVSGALEDVTAKSYQNGEWVDWIRQLFNKGDQCESITGGWGVTKNNVTAGTINSNNNIYISTATEGKINTLGTMKKVSKGNCTTLYAEVVGIKASTSPGCTVCVTKTKDEFASSSLAAFTQGNTAGTWTVRLTDVPEEFYVSCYVYYAGEYMEISKIWMG